MPSEEVNDALEILAALGWECKGHDAAGWNPLKARCNVAAKNRCMYRFMPGAITMIYCRCSCHSV